ncbi:hypothetical protein J3458_013218 [Metarhizium acridum]|uniref:uncharacterized protein n=1 Tax=Metarhizium acridum TaxID=92637 RepID=UPI001C6BB37D|nr:hypothetical protein J3458_013218 [Metarhizium acridum]
MDYYIKRAVERVRQRRRSREDIEEEISIDENLHLAARNSIANMDVSSDDSIAPRGSAEYKNVNRWVDVETLCRSDVCDDGGANNWQGLQ